MFEFTEDIAKKNVKKRLKKAGLNHKELDKREFRKLVEEEEEEILAKWAIRGAMVAFGFGLFGF